MSVLLWTGLGYLLGALPFSFWLGQLFLHIDIRCYGDGNPGAVNAWKAGGWPVGLPALLLDYLKGALPVGLAHFACGLSGWSLIPIALATVLGHATSPFLRLRGGKAVAVTLGIWTGLTLWEGPTVLGTCLGLFFLIQAAEAWAVIWGTLGFGVYLLLQGAGGAILTVWAGNSLVLLWKHYRDLRRPIRLRPWIERALGRPS
jgi:glycerol-3-phosphate acyltransferase PlsY